MLMKSKGVIKDERSLEVSTVVNSPAVAPNDVADLDYNITPLETNKRHGASRERE